MSLTIYGIAASRAVRPLWVAHELGLAFEHIHTPYQGGATRTPEFLARNPNGRIPVVVDAQTDGDIVVWESMACQRSVKSGIVLPTAPMSSTRTPGTTRPTKAAKWARRWSS